MKNPLWQVYLSKRQDLRLFCITRFFENIHSGKGTVFWVGKRQVENLQ